MLQKVPSSRPSAADILKTRVVEGSLQVTVWLPETRRQALVVLVAMVSSEVSSCMCEARQDGKDRDKGTTCSYIVTRHLKDVFVPEDEGQL